MNRRENPPQLPIVRLPQQVGLLITWALLMWLSFPWPNLWLLAYVALVPLTLVGVRGQPLRRVVGLTYLVGLLWWLVMVGWVRPVTVPGYVTVSLYLAVYPLAYVLVMRLIHQRLALPFTFTVPLVWVALEYVRGLVMTGFPWFLLGHSQATWVIQIADVVGAYGVSFFVGMFNGLVLDLMTRPLFRPVRLKGRGKRQGLWWGLGGPMRVPLFAFSMALVMTLTYGSYRTAEADRIERDSQLLRVSVVQTDVPQSNKINSTDEQDLENFGEMLRLSEQAMQADPPPDVIVWPETMVPRAINDEAVDVWQSLGTFYADYREAIEKFAADNDVALIVGAHAMDNWHEVERDGMRYMAPRDRYNAAYLIEPPGEITQRYDKLHRVPFGEYMPWVEQWPWLQSVVLKLTPYESDYSLRPGDSYTRFTLDDTGSGRTWQLAAPICYEDVVSYVPREMVWSDDGRKLVDVLVNLTNDGWFAGTAEGPQHEQIARFRSVENRVPMARAVNRGVSGFIDSAGRIRGRVVVDGETQQVAGAATMDLYMDTRWTVFGRVGDLFAALCLAMATGLGIFSASGRFFRGSTMTRRRATAATAIAATALFSFAAASPALAQQQDEAPPPAEGEPTERVEFLGGPEDEVIGPQPLRIDPDEAAERRRQRDEEQAARQRRQQEQREQLKAAQDEPLDAENPLPLRPVEELREMTPAELETYAIELLVQASMSDYAVLRSNAVEALQQRPKHALPVTHRLLEDPNPAVRYAAAVTAGMLEMEDLAPALQPLVEDEHPAVRAAALSSLHELGERVNLTPMAGMLESRDPGLRGNVALLLGLMGNRSAVPMLKRAAVQPMPRASAAEAAVVRIQIAEAIARLDDDSGLSSLRSGAYSQFDEVRVVAIIALGAVGDRRMEVGIEQFLENPPMEIQLAAAGTLARLGNFQGRSIALEMAEHENPVIRSQTAWVLGWFEDEQTGQKLTQLLGDVSEPVRVAAAAALLRRQSPAAGELSEETPR